VCQCEIVNRESGTTQKVNVTTQKVNGITQKVNGITHTDNGMTQTDNGMTHTDNGITAKLAHGKFGRMNPTMEQQSITTSGISSSSRVISPHHM
jgi:hypothetical protein